MVALTGVVGASTESGIHFAFTYAPMGSMRDAFTSLSSDLSPSCALGCLSRPSCKAAFPPRQPPAAASTSISTSSSASSGVPPTPSTRYRPDPDNPDLVIVGEGEAGYKHVATQVATGLERFNEVLHRFHFDRALKIREVHSLSLPLASSRTPLRRFPPLASVDCGTTKK